MPTPNPGGQAFLPYLNLGRGIRIDYPSSWAMQEQASPVSFSVAFGSPQENAADQFRENLTLTIQPVFPEVTQDVFVQSWQAFAKQAQLNIVELGAAMLASRNVCRIVFNTPLQSAGPMAGTVMMFLFVSGTLGYTVAYTGQQGHFETFLPTVQQMLSTLQIR